MGKNASLIYFLGTHMAEPWDCANAALDFCDGLSGLSDPAVIAEYIKHAIAGFGLEHFIITDIPNGNERFEQSVLLRHWPAGWFETYASEVFVKVDPVIRRCRSTTALFAWDEVPYDPETEPGAHKVMRRALDFGLTQGLSLAIHGLSGYETCFSVSGRTPDLTPRTRPALHLMMMYGYERLRQILALETELVNPLTPREKEVLCWAAAGKSAAETADLMTITERTVNAHASAAIAKLGANNRTQAVVRAMAHRYIRI